MAENLDESELDCIFVINCGYAGIFKGHDGLNGTDLMEKWIPIESKATSNIDGNIVHEEGLDFFRAIAESLTKEGFEEIAVFSLGNQLVYGDIKTVMLSHMPVF